MTVVFLNRFDNPQVLLKNLAQALRLAVAKLQHDPPLWLEERRGLRRQAPPVVQAIRPAVQRPVRIMIPHLGLQ